MPETVSFRGARVAAKRSLDARPSAGRGTHRSDALGKSAEPLLPEGDLARKRRLARDPLLDRAPLMRAQHAEHIFGGARRPAIVFVSGA